VSPDYNGTLTPIVRDPKWAYMSGKVNEIVFLFRSLGDPEGAYISVRSVIYSISNLDLQGLGCGRGA